LIIRPQTNKFLLNTDEISVQSLTKVLEKIVSGEGKFTKLKGEFPKFAKRN